jgi:hypothetical protein
VGVVKMAVKQDGVTICGYGGEADSGAARSVRESVLPDQIRQNADRTRMAT